MRYADCTPGREPRSVAASYYYHFSSCNNNHNNATRGKVILIHKCMSILVPHQIKVPTAFRIVDIERLLVLKETELFL